MRVLILVSLLLSLPLYAQTFEQITFIRFHEQQASVRGAAMGGVSDDDPILNPAALGETKRAFFSLSGVQLEPLNGNGLAHALAAVPLGSFVVAAHYRGNPVAHGSQPLLAGAAAPRTAPLCPEFGCILFPQQSDMFERSDRRYGLSAAWTAGNVTLGAGAELYELDERIGLGYVSDLPPNNSTPSPTNLLVQRVSGRELVPNAGIRVRVSPRVSVAAAYNGSAKFAQIIEACQLGPGESQMFRCTSEYTRVDTLSQRSPSAIRASVTVQPHASLTLTGEAVRRHYAEVLTASTPQVFDPYQDVTELHAGAEYRIGNVALRAGWWKDPVRYADQYYPYFTSLGRRINHLTFGAGVDVGRARLEVAVDDADLPSLRRAVVGVAFR